MIIVVNHLTRMQKGYICLAGIDVNTRRAVRPVLRMAQLPVAVLAREGGWADVANVLDLGAVNPTPDPPHIEDHEFQLSAVKVLGAMPDPDFWKLLNEVCRTRLRDVFGPDLKCIGGERYGTDVGKGTASLGCFRPAFHPRLHLDKSEPGRTQVRMRLRDGDQSLDAVVTDIRLYPGDYATPDPKRVEGLNKRLRASKGIILSVGLSRAYPKYPTKEQTPRHWLQVNNIHFQERPAWQLGTPTR